MAVEVGKGVIYRWNTIRENELSSIQSWTDAGKKIREVTDDVYNLAVALAPVGKTGTLKRSHYRGGWRREGRYRIHQVVGNRAKHALWVHEGTEELSGMFVVFRPGGGWMGPVSYGEVGIRRGKRWQFPGSGGRAGKFGVYFTHYTFGGQVGQPWLERAGRAAYRMPGNN